MATIKANFDGDIGRIGKAKGTAFLDPDWQQEHLTPDRNVYSGVMVNEAGQVSHLICPITKHHSCSYVNICKANVAGTEVLMIPKKKPLPTLAEFLTTWLDATKPSQSVEADSLQARTKDAAETVTRETVDDTMAAIRLAEQHLKYGEDSIESAAKRAAKTISEKLSAPALRWKGTKGVLKGLNHDTEQTMFTEFPPDLYQALATHIKTLPKISPQDKSRRIQ